MQTNLLSRVVLILGVRRNRPYIRCRNVGRVPECRHAADRYFGERAEYGKGLMLMTANLAIPVAQYLRMSTERQEYSLENQSRAIAQYAESHGFSIVQTYSDPARSGMLLRRRKGLQGLIQDVVHGQASFKAILVYDVSRWGRFVDTDESAHYEFLCKSAGVRVLLKIPVTLILRPSKGRPACGGIHTRNSWRRASTGLDRYSRPPRDRMA